MKETYFIYTMSRSGHTAILNWIAANYNGIVRVHPQPYYGILDGHLTSEKEYIIENEGPDELDIYALEDWMPMDFIKYNYKDFPELNVVPVKYIWSIRDPFNTASSLLKRKVRFDDVYASNPGHTGTFLTRNEIYQAQIDEFTRKTNYLSNPIIDINFNKWFVSREYRLKLCHKLRLGTDDNELNYTARGGGGSSFQGFNEEGEDLKVLDRWTWKPQLLDDTIDIGLRVFSEKYFGFNPDLS